MNNYINSLLTITDESIIDNETGNEIIATWKDDLLKAYADVVNYNNGDILEIGFGMGIFTSHAYNENCTSYTIVENHPQIIPLLLLWAADKPNVTVIQGDWYDNVELINSKTYDGIFFDTYRDDHSDQFRNSVVDVSIKETGVFGYFLITEPDQFNYTSDLITNSVMLENTDSDGVVYEYTCDYAYVQYPISE